MSWKNGDPSQILYATQQPKKKTSCNLFHFWPHHQRFCNAKSSSCKLARMKSINLMSFESPEVSGGNTKGKKTYEERYLEEATLLPPTTPLSSATPRRSVRLSSAPKLNYKENDLMKSCLIGSSPLLSGKKSSN